MKETENKLKTKMLVFQGYIKEHQISNYHQPLYIDNTVRIIIHKIINEKMHVVHLLWLLKHSTFQWEFFPSNLYENLSLCEAYTHNMVTFICFYYFEICRNSLVLSLEETYVTRLQ